MLLKRRLEDEDEAGLDRKHSAVCCNKINIIEDDTEFGYIRGS